MKQVVIEGDCFELIKTLPDNSIDLVITSPPYADIVSYGKNISIKKPDDYVDWILPLFNEIHRVLKPSGSFILNINDICVNGYRSTYVFDLVSRTNKETKLKLYDNYTWVKKSGIPNGSTKRFRNMTEYILHYVKDAKQMKFYMDRVMEPAKETSLDRASYPTARKAHQRIIDGERQTNLDNFTQDDKVRPNNVFYFKSANASRDNTIRHPAPFHVELPEYFINLLTDVDDVVVDVFSGIATTGMAAKKHNRRYIGYELNPKYVEFSVNRLNGVKQDTYMINQYDLDGNFIKSWKSITEIENTLGFDSHNHIEDCIRKGNKTSYGFIWKAEPNE